MPFNGSSFKGIQKYFRNLGSSLIFYLFAVSLLLLCLLEKLFSVFFRVGLFFTTIIKQLRNYLNEVFRNWKRRFYKRRNYTHNSIFFLPHVLQNLITFLVNFLWHSENNNKKRTHTQNVYRIIWSLFHADNKW